MNNLIGQHLGPYRILEQIGIGGMATVYKAYQPAMDRYVAIKVIAAHFAQDETFLRRFRREAKAVAQLEHAHILPVHDYGEAEGRPYLVMRFLEAGTLKERMAEGPLPLTEINRIVGQVGSALDYAHRMGVVHRDVKPANVLLDAEGDSFLTDFGLAKMIESSAQLTATGVGLGTPAYMSPEQGKGAKVDSRSDVYSLGVMLYEMVTGHAPYEAETPLAVVLKHIQEPLPLPRSVQPDLPEEVERVILRALAKEPDDRFQTAGEMVRVLDAAVRAAQAAARTEPAIAAEVAAEPAVAETAAARTRKPLPAGWRRTAAWVAVGLVALVVLFLILSRVPLKVQISGGQLEVVRVVEETPAEAAATPTPQPATIPAHTPEPTSAVSAPVSLEPGETLGYLNDDVCIFDSQGGTTLMGLAETFICFSGLSWSPDGARFIFSACHEDDAADPSECHNDLYIANRDGSNATPLVHDLHANFFPAWSPDGEWIAFHDNSAVTIIRPDGTDENILVQGGNTCPQAVAWSPDSQRIAWLGELGICETGESRDIWVINRDGSGMNTIFHSSDQVLENQVAWNPDGESVAVLTTDGVAYLVDADCPDQPNGCDESSRTEIVTFPEHWLHTYYPQWGGEAGAPTPAPGSMAEQARAFAEPILTAIADRAPDFEDDFSTADEGWKWNFIEQGSRTGHFEIAEGVARMTLSEGSGACFSEHDWFVFKNLVLSFDSRQVSGGYGSNQQVTLRLPGGYLNFDITSGTRDWRSGKCQGEQDYPVADGGGDVVRTIGETNHTLVVARGPRLAIYLNDDPVIYVEDDDLDAAHDVSFACYGQPDIVCEFDNVKLWNLENVPGMPEAEATPAPSPAATVLAHWPFDGDLKDASGNGYDLQQTGENLGFVSGCFGQAIHFNDDATSYLTRGQDDDAFDFGSSDYSAELWVKFDRAPSETHEQALIEKCTGGGCGTTGWGATATTMLWRFIHNPGTHGVVDSPPLFWQSGNWYHMVAVRQGETVYLYINGEQVASEWASDIADNDAPLILGRRFDESQLFPLIGALDEVTIYEGALSTAEVRDHYQRGASCAGAAATPSPGSPADQARAFAEPILAAIADRAPDFEDDFSTTDKGWGLDQFEITNGAARATIADGSVTALSPPWLVSKDFVLSFDIEQTSGSWVSDLRVHLYTHDNMVGLLMRSSQGSWSMGGIAAGQEGNGTSPIGETTQVLFVARGAQLALYLNDVPVAYVESQDIDEAKPIDIGCVAAPDMVCKVDNVKLWNLEDVPGLP